jgi:hypothetical protein
VHSVHSPVDLPAQCCRANLAICLIASGTRCRGLNDWLSWAQPATFASVLLVPLSSKSNLKAACTAKGLSSVPSSPHTPGSHPRQTAHSKLLLPRPQAYVLDIQAEMNKVLANNPVCHPPPPPTHKLTCLHSGKPLGVLLPDPVQHPSVYVYITHTNMLEYFGGTWTNICCRMNKQSQEQCMSKNG